MKVVGVCGGVWDKKLIQFLLELFIKLYEFEIIGIFEGGGQRGLIIGGLI